MSAADSVAIIAYPLLPPLEAFPTFVGVLQPSSTANARTPPNIGRKRANALSLMNSPARHGHVDEMRRIFRLDSTKQRGRSDADMVKCNTSKATLIKTSDGTCRTDSNPYSSVGGVPKAKPSQPQHETPEKGVRIHHTFGTRLLQTDPLKKHNIPIISVRTLSASSLDSTLSQNDNDAVAHTQAADQEESKKSKSILRWLSGIETSTDNEQKAHMVCTRSSTPSVGSVGSTLVKELPPHVNCERRSRKEASFISGAPSKSAVSFQTATRYRSSRLPLLPTSQQARNPGIRNRNPVKFNIGSSSDTESDASSASVLGTTKGLINDAPKRANGRRMKKYGA